MNKIELGESDALIITDVQNCFLPGGSLPVQEADGTLGPLNGALEIFSGKRLPVFLTRDWHPPDHCSFQTQGGPWPPHCVQNTNDAAFSPRLRSPPNAIVISKAANPKREQYSAFYGRDENCRAMAERIAFMGIRRVFIGGIATEYCVFNTVKDALQAGLKVFVFKDAVRAVNANPGDGQAAIAQMKRLGAVLIETGDVQN